MQLRSHRGNRISHRRIHDPDQKSSDFVGNLFGLNPKTSENYGKRMGDLQFLSPVDALERKKERGPRHDGSGGGARSRQ